MLADQYMEENRSDKSPADNYATETHLLDEEEEKKSSNIKKFRNDKKPRMLTKKSKTEALPDMLAN